MAILNSKGSSLVEVIVAMFILALLVTGLNACVVHLVNSNRTSKEISEATALGNQLFEQMRSSDFQNIISGSDTVDNKFIRGWTVTDNGSMRTVRLSVFWPDEDSHNITMSTIIARP